MEKPTKNSATGRYYCLLVVGIGICVAIDPCFALRSSLLNFYLGSDISTAFVHWRIWSVKGDYMPSDAIRGDARKKYYRKQMFVGAPRRR